jgi:hypothetical protein
VLAFTVISGVHYVFVVGQRLRTLHMGTASKSTLSA